MKLLQFIIKEKGDLENSLVENIYGKEGTPFSFWL